MDEGINILDLVNDYQGSGPLQSFPVKAVEASKKTKCTLCRKSGHNRRTCPLHLKNTEKKARYKPARVRQQEKKTPFFQKYIPSYDALFPMFVFFRVLFLGVLIVGISYLAYNAILHGIKRVEHGEV